MKKFLKKFSIILIFILFLVPCVYASDAKVDSLDIYANVNTDGSMDVVETIKWDIEGNLNGVYRDILIEGKNLLNSATGITVTDVLVNDEPYVSSRETLKNGTSGKYNVNEIDGGVRIKIFSPSEDEYKTTKISYTLNDVVVKYNDIAEMYWNFIGDGWNYGIGSVNIVITVPENLNTLKIFGHGPLNGMSEIVNENTLTLKVQNLRANEQVDARILMDKDAFTVVKNQKENAIDRILEDEKVLAEDANHKREVAKVWLYVTIFVVIFAVTLPIISYISFRRKIPKAKFNGKYYRELPEDYGPSVMNKVLFPVTGVLSSKDMLATLLDLVRKKYVDIEKIYKDNDKTKKVLDYKLIKIKDNLDDLSEVERYFIDTMIFKDKKEITLKELNKENTKNETSQKEAFKEYEKWKEIIDKKAKEVNVIKEKKTGTGKVIGITVLCTILTVVLLFVGISKDYADIMVIAGIGMFILIYEIVGISISVTTLNARTEKGIEHEKMWKAFKRFLLDFSKLDERGFEDLILWEHYLVYATGLGIADKVIKQLKIVYPTEFNDANMLNNYAMFSMITDDSSFRSFENSFTTASSQAFSMPSSASGSGGGFSSGAGSGGGGGGGGGF